MNGPLGNDDDDIVYSDGLVGLVLITE